MCSYSIKIRAVVIFRCISESAEEGIQKVMTCRPIWIKPYSSTSMASNKQLISHQFKNNNRVSRFLDIAKKFILSVTNACPPSIISTYIEGMSLLSFH